MSAISFLFLKPIFSLFHDFWKMLLANGDNLKIVAATIAVFVGSVKGISFFRTKISAISSRRTLISHLTSQAYTTQEIQRATTHYIIPDCQNLDPGGAEDWRLDLPVRENSFQALDHVLETRTESKHSLILADSGMGKTSLLLNYAARHWHSKQRRSKFNLVLIPLGQRNVEEQVKAVALQNRNTTVLLLDALDEDPKAIQNHRARLDELLRMTSDFRHVLITSRTQFFPKDEEIPTQTGIIKVGVIGAGESREYLFYKMYLSPFSDEQVDSFVRRRFKPWRWKSRDKAHTLISQVRDLTVRPMILAHIPDLLELPKKSKAPSSLRRFEKMLSAQIYEEMVSAWLMREHPLVRDIEALRDFSEQLAINIVLNREKRGGEKVSPEELDEFLLHYQGANSGTAQLVKHSLERWQVRGRSLLNRDASGNWKFAHRSILEYLAALSILRRDINIPTVLLTDQIRKFIKELNELRMRSGQDAKRILLIPLTILRKTGMVFASLQIIHNTVQDFSTSNGDQASPLNFEFTQLSVVNSDLVAAVRRFVTQSLSKEKIDDLTFKIFKRSFPDRTYLGSTSFPAPRVTITDFVTATKWYIYLNLCFDGEGYFEDDRPNVYLRLPTLDEARTFGRLLALQPDLLAFAWQLTDILNIATSDRIENEGWVVVRYRFDGVKGIDETISCNSTSSVPGPDATIVLSALVEVEPTLTT